MKILILALLLATPLSCWALSPEQVLVIANGNARSSTELARYYMKKRGIPPGNLLELKVTSRESCTRREYQQQVAEPVRRFLRDREALPAIRCLVTMYGVPLKVGPAEPGKADQGAALDSELALVLKEGYLLSGWLSNPYFLGYQDRVLATRKEETLFVSRLDGPSAQVVRRLIDQSLEAEAQGLGGAAYFDARWPWRDGKDLKDYAYYDNSIHRAAQRLRSSGRVEVRVNDIEELFQPGEAPGAALYCGWYRLGRYLDAFDWRPGAVGYHIASGECVTLRGKTEGWCRGMLEDGVAATVGPVAEPYVQAFPVPEVFFGLLVDGHYSLAEVYFLSTPFLSWQMILVGDPLYRPFRNRLREPATSR